MSTLQASRRNAVAATQAPSVTPQDRRPAPANIAPESAFGAAVKRRGALGVGGMLALQAAAGNRAVAGLVQAKRGDHPGSGSPMPPAVRAKMERAFGADFSSVRIHQGPQAQALGALAYTQGTSIHFAPGQYHPDSRSGQALLGHELTHVVQQSQGRVRPTTQAKGAAINDDSTLEHEADALGDRAARGESVREAAGPSGSPDHEDPPSQGRQHQATALAPPAEPVIQGSFIGFLGGAALLGLGTLGLAALTVGTGGAALPFAAAAALGGGALGHYETESTTVAPPNPAVASASKGSAEPEVTVQLYYSQSVLGHLTIIMTDSKGSSRRIHFVLKEQARSAAMRKVQQVTGYATGQVLDDTPENSTIAKYSEKERIGHWNVSLKAADAIIKYAESVKSGAPPSYGYIVYSTNVDNCGSFAIKALAAGGISVTLPRWKTWLQLPSLIKDDVKSQHKKTE